MIERGAAHLPDNPPPRTRALLMLNGFANSSAAVRCPKHGGEQSRNS